MQGAAGKTSTAPLETIKMQLVQSRSLGTLEAVQAIWHRGGLRGFFRQAHGRQEASLLGRGGGGWAAACLAGG